MILLTVPEAARRLRIGTSTLYVLTKQGKFPCVRLGGSVRVPVAALEAWIVEQTRRPS